MCFLRRRTSLHKKSVTLLAALGVLPTGLASQALEGPSDPKHVAVEATTLVLEQGSVRRLGLAGLVISGGDAALGASAGHPTGSVRVGTRIGALDVSAFLDVVRRERAVRLESTQKVVTLSGSAAEVSSQRTMVGAYGQTASAGPALWVEPVALENGHVRLRVWTAVGQVRPGPFGSVWEDVPVEARTEITVPSGTPVVISTTDQRIERTDRELLGRGSSATATNAWIVVRPRIIDDPGEAFEMPEGVAEEWLKH